MTAYLLINHLLNFLAPAAFVALLLVGMTRIFPRFFGSKNPKTKPWYKQVAIIFVINVLLLFLGLLVFGRDGKMLTYTALVVGAALSQWMLLRVRQSEAGGNSAE